jgi:hypothetical protein
MRGYRVRVSGQAVFPLLVLGFSVAYAMQVRGLSVETLLFAKPVLYICVILSLYLLAKEGVRVERASDQGQHDAAAVSMVRGLTAESSRMLILTTNIFLYVLSLEYVGFLATSILFLVVTMLLCGVRRRLVLIAVPLSVVGSLYVLLAWWLKFPLPPGVILKLFTE